MEGRQNLLLRPRLEVNQQVPATDQVHARERRVAQDILPREHAQLPEALAHPVAAVLFHKETPQPFRRDLVHQALEVKPVAGFHQQRLVEVGGEDLQPRGAARNLSAILFKRHRQRIRFLARRAARHPNAHRLLAPRRNELRENDSFQRFERFRVAEKAGDADQHVRIQRAEFGGVALEKISVSLQRVELPEHHAPRETPLDGAGFIKREVHPETVAQQQQDSHQGIGVGRHRAGPDRRHIGMPGHLHQFPRNIRRREHKIHAPGRRGALRHGIIFGRLSILGKSDPAFRFDGLQSQRPIRGRAGQHHPDGPLMLVLGQRLEEIINRALRSAGLRPRLDHQDPLLDGQARVGRDDINVIGQDRLAVGSLAHGHRGDSAQKLGQRALMRRIEMLDQHEAQARIGRQMLEQFHERFQPARRRANPNDGKRLCP